MSPSEIPNLSSDIRSDHEPSINTLTCARKYSMAGISNLYDQIISGESVYFTVIGCTLAFLPVLLKRRNHRTLWEQE